MHLKKKENIISRLNLKFKIVEILERRRRII